MLVALGISGCAVRRITHIAKSPARPPSRTASAGELIEMINRQSAAVRTVSATVNMEPTVGSLYSGVIKQYRDLRGYILLERPGWVRIIGLAPVVRTDIFDMSSNGERFSLYIPSQNKLYVGSNRTVPESGNSLENLRPQHIVNALLLQPVDPAKESYFRVEADEGESQDYVIGVLDGVSPGQENLERKIWFDRSDLQIFRVQFYDPAGACVEDVRYATYTEYDGLRYPSRITIDRTSEDYSLVITILRATFNQPIALSKFSLKAPPGAQRVDLDAVPAQGGPGDP